MRGFALLSLPHVSSRLSIPYGALQNSSQLFPKTHQVLFLKYMITMSWTKMERRVDPNLCRRILMDSVQFNDGFSFTSDFGVPMPCADRSRNGRRKKSRFVDDDQSSDGAILTTIFKSISFLGC